jgi:D-proline reductase (dithiol) PrdB
VALASSGGVYTTDQPPFDMINRAGDDSVRWIPHDADPGDLRFADDHYDHTEADSDPNCMFPLARLRELADEGFIGSVAARHVGFMGFVPDPTRFFEEIMPGVARELLDDGVDAVLMGPGCPMCHRTVALAQRALESAGIPTVSLTLAPAITIGHGVPRALQVRMPFGNAFGEPGDRWTQRAILKALIEWIGAAPGPDAIVRLPYSWAARAIPEDQEDCTDGACFVPRRPAPEQVSGGGSR